VRGGADLAAELLAGLYSFVVAASARLSEAFFLHRFLDLRPTPLPVLRPSFSMVLCFCGDLKPFNGKGNGGARAGMHESRTSRGPQLGGWACGERGPGTGIAIWTRPIVSAEQVRGHVLCSSFARRHCGSLFWRVAFVGGTVRKETKGVRQLVAVRGATGICRVGAGFGLKVR